MLGNIWQSSNYAAENLGTTEIKLSYSSLFQFLDTQNTKSQITYKLQGARYRVSNGTQQAYFNYIPSNSSHGCIIIAQEMTP